MLVLGDSILWGQGLLEGDKCAAQVQQQLQNALHLEVRPPVMFAHSGASIMLPPGARDEEPLWGEIPAYAPSITAQVDAAAKDYSAADLVLLDGGSNDLGVMRLINPLERGATIYADAQKYCGQPMCDLLGDVLTAFPRARVVVTGYYPVVSNQSGPGGIRHLLNAFGLEGIWKKIVEEGAQDIEASLFFQLIRHKLANLSTAWHDGSAQAQRGAVDAINAYEAGQGRPQRVVFAPITFEPAHCIECEQTYLWIGVDDDQHQNRLAYLEGPLPAWLDMPTRLEIPIASLGHPNRNGAKAYAAAVMQALAPWIQGAEAPTAARPALKVSIEGAPHVPPGQKVTAQVTVHACAETGTPVSGSVEMTNHDDAQGTHFPLNQPFTWEFHNHLFKVPDQGIGQTTTRIRVLAEGYTPVWVRW
jgi:lysophospholipase L1-like esterase